MQHEVKAADDDLPLAPQQIQKSANIILPDPAEQQPLNPLPAGSRGTLSLEAIDAVIQKHFPPQKIAAMVQDGDVPKYKRMAGDITDGEANNNSADRQAIEMRLIEKYEIVPLKAQIDQLEAEIDALEKNPGIEPDDEQLEARKAELNELYESLDNWEARVEALKGGMLFDNRKNRLAAINAELEVEREDLKAVEKVDKVHFESGIEEPAMKRRQARLLAVSGHAAGRIIEMQNNRINEFTPFTRSAMEGIFKSSFKATFDAKYHSPTDEPDPSLAEIQPFLEDMQPVIDKANVIQQQLRQLKDERAVMVAQRIALLKESPHLIQNVESREQAAKDLSAIQQERERVQHCNQRLAALENPGPDQEQAVIEHGSVSQAREHYKNERSKANDRRSDLQNAFNNGLAAAAADEFDQSEEGMAILEQMAVLKQEQAEILLPYKEEKLAEYKSIMPGLFAEQAIAVEENEAKSGQDLKSALKQSAAADKNLDTKLKVAELDLRRNFGKAPYEMYKQNVEMAAQEFKMRPEIIEDDDKRAKVTGLKQQVADVKEVIAQCDEEIAKLNKVGARLRSLVHGHNDDRKELKALYAKQKEAALEQLSSLEEQLDIAAHEAVSVSMKQGMLNEIKPPAPPKAAVPANQAPAQNQPIQPPAAKNGLPPPPNYPAPPPPGQEMTKQPKARINAKAKDAGDGMPPSQENGNMILEPEAKVENAAQNGQNLAEGNQEAPAAHKPSVGEALHRSHSMPNLSGPQVAAHQTEGQQPKKGVGKDKSLRASGSWQAAKPSAAKATGIKT